MKLLALLALISSPVFAADIVSWDALKAACKNPGAVERHYQNVPSNIVVSCSEKVTSWVQSGSSSTSLKSTTKVAYSVTSSKYQVNQKEVDMPSASNSAAYPLFKEVEQVTQHRFDVDCSTFSNPKSDYANMSAEQFCSKMLSEQKSATPQIVGEASPTGRYIDFGKANWKDVTVKSDPTSSTSGSNGQSGQRGQGN